MCLSLVFLIPRILLCLLKLALVMGQSINDSGPAVSGDSMQVPLHSKLVLNNVQNIISEIVNPTTLSGTYAGGTSVASASSIGLTIGLVTLAITLALIGLGVVRSRMFSHSFYSLV